MAEIATSYCSFHDKPRIFHFASLKTCLLKMQSSFVPGVRAEAKLKQAIEEMSAWCTNVGMRSVEEIDVKFTWACLGENVKCEDMLAENRNAELRKMEEIYMKVLRHGWKMILLQIRYPCKRIPSKL
nr:hypothetical protein [Tanacetum cinerariifolium]